MKMVATILILLSLSCGPTNYVMIDGYCVPESIYSAWSWTARTKQPVRIAISHIKPGIDHAQAQGLTENGWQYLTSQHGTVSLFHSHFGTEPFRYTTLDEFIREQREYR